MKWDQIVDEGIIVTQQKTGTKIWIPLHKDLAKLLDQIKERKTDTILTSVTGQSFTADNLKHRFKAATCKAVLPDDLVFHGLRKTAAVRLAEAGCTTEQIKAITGHKTDDMAAYYAKQASQKLLAKAAMGKFEGEK